MTEERRQRRFVLPSWRVLAAGGAAAGLGIVALMALQDPSPDASRFTVTNAAEEATTARTDPLQAELLRCRDLPAGTNDAACREAWEVNRRRFLGESRSFVPPADISPSSPSPVAERP